MHKQYAFAQQADKIELLSANSLEFDEKLGNGAKRLIGNVAFKHQNAIMNCDSAYLFTESNSVKAYGHIHINQNDSTHIYGDLLNYEGQTKLANLQGNVTMLDKEMTLTTSQLDYDLKTKTAFYHVGAKIISTKNQNTLTSNKGYYYTDSKTMFYKDQVKLVNPEMEIMTDTLKYNTISEVATFEGPTAIQGKKDFIYCENGWYNTKKNIAQFKKNAYLLSENKKLQGDSLYYDRNLGLGKAIKNVNIIDTIENIFFRSDLALHFQKTNTSILTGNLLMKVCVENDTLYLHSDSLKMITDSLKKDKNIFAYRRVKFFKSNISGLCDSLAYNLSDSLLKMFYKPAIWSENHQITGDFIAVKSYQGTIENISVKNNCFVISKEDSLKFNQIKGKSLFAIFEKNRLSQVNVYENGQSYYYGREKNGDYIGLNKAESSNLTIKLKDSKINQITYLQKPNAILIPLDQIKPEETLLKGFKWLEKLKPKNKEEVFIWN